MVTFGPSQKTVRPHTFWRNGMEILDTKTRHRRWFVGIGIAFATSLLTLLLFHTPFLRYSLGIDIFQSLERRVYDVLLKARGTRVQSGHLVMVRIDEYTINKMDNEYPLPRDQVGAAMTLLSTFGARAVALDVYMAPSRRDSIEGAWMVEYLREAENIYQAIGAFIPAFDAEATAAPLDVDSTAHYVIGRFGIPAPPAHTFPRSPFIDDYPFPELAEISKGVGHTNLILDPLDGIMRSGPLFIEYAGKLYPTLGLALAMERLGVSAQAISFEMNDLGTLVRGGPLEIQTGLHGEVYINFVGPGKVFPEVSLYDILMAAKTQDSAFLSQFQDKVCIIGPTARAVGDYYSMPYSEGTPGYLAHANMYDTIITGNFIRDANSTIQLILLPVIVAIVGIVATTIRTRIAVIISITLALALILFAYFAFVDGNTLYRVAGPLFALFVCFGSSLTYRAATEGHQRKMITNMFARYVDRTVVRQLIENPLLLTLGGESREITVLFSDIKDFTAMSERLSPDTLVRLINTYLTEMTNIIMDHRGTVDKFIGDAIMAFWGAPISDLDAQYQACVATLEMKRRLDSLRPRWRKLTNVEIGHRVGINTGRCIVGNMGSESKFNYTAMGDPVNLASRLEGINKLYGTTILMSGQTYRGVTERIRAREIDIVQVAGRTEPVTVYELIGLATDPLVDSAKYFLELYHQGLAAYRARKWDEGIGYLEGALAYVPTDPVAHMFIERMRMYKHRPPKDDWNGVFVLGSSGS